jgi:16S rRNA (guanine966-N2)-methyltransferase
MRIIAGTLRRRTLLAPPDAQITRPITDRVKQSLFDRLASLGIFRPDVAEPPPGTPVKPLGKQDPKTRVGLGLDLFAGVGSLGLEALSRGTESVLFIERNRPICQLLKQNVANMALGERADVMNMDVLGAGWIGLLPRKPLRLIFCDPPYALAADPAGMAQLKTLLEDLAPKAEVGGIMVLRTDTETAPPHPVGWNPPVTMSFGSMGVHLYSRPEPSPSPDPNVEADPV